MIDLSINNDKNIPLNGIDEQAIIDVLEAVLAHEGVEADCEISMLITDNDGIRALNREYRDKDTPTDVLSFPQYDEIPNMPYLYLGDIVISVERCEEQASDFGHSFEREFMYLTVHSCLHLLAYDHMNDDDKKEMRMREKAIMASVEILR